MTAQRRSSSEEHDSRPIESLWQLLQDGQIGSEHALMRAALPATLDVLTPPYVDHLSDLARDMAWEAWPAAIALHQLTLAATDALDARSNGSVSTESRSDIAAMQRNARLTWIEIVTRAVGQVPDGRLFRDAVITGEQLVTEARASSDSALEAHALYKLGVLHLDPYSAGRSSTDYEIQMRFWRDRLHDYLGDKLQDVPSDERYVPEPIPALTSAVEYLRRASELQREFDRGVSQKAMGDALSWLRLLAPPGDSAPVVRCYREALAWFDPRRYPRECAAVLGGLQAQGEPVPRDTLDALLETSIEVHEQSLGPTLAADFAMQLFAILAAADPPRALALSERMLTLSGLQANEHQRDSVYRRQLGLIIETHDGAAVELLQRARMSPEANDEARGIQWVDAAAAAAPQLDHAYAGAIMWLRAQLQVGAAVNAINAGETEAAVEWYFRALKGYLDLGFRQHASNCLARMTSLANADDPAVTIRMVATLAEVSIRCQAELGESATKTIVDACRVLMQKIAGHGTTKATLVLMLFNVAKGLRFAAVAGSCPRYDWRTDAEAVALMERVDQAREAIATHDEATVSPLDDSLFLAAYIGPGERGSGNRARDLLENLERAFDSHVNLRILERATGSAELFPVLERLQAALDERTVLVNYYIGASPQGGLAVYIFAITNDDAWISLGASESLPSGYAVLSHQGRSATVTLAGMEIQRLLTEITASPWGADVSSDAARLLQTHSNNYLGNLPTFLDAQRAAGKDHICFVPHGPLHFVPLHLLGNGKVLADDWIVTYLPNVRMLLRPPPHASGDAGRKNAVVSIGVGFADRPGSGQAIPEATTEARAIARLFGVEPLIDDAATESAIRAALQEARHVHIATHGEHCLHAPSFQQLHATPTAHDDGIIHAYEVLALDASHLECLTLSACETSLGRFDMADDLRGLPAAFFISGAATVVGTLWNVETNTSQYFFTAFYTALKKGRSRLDAFGAAQRKTRKKFPKYRDWGAFHMAGEWR